MFITIMEFVCGLGCGYLIASAVYKAKHERHMNDLIEAGEKAVAAEKLYSEKANQLGFFSINDETKIEPRTGETDPVAFITGTEMEKLEESGFTTTNLVYDADEDRWGCDAEFSYDAIACDPLDIGISKWVKELIESWDIASGMIYYANMDRKICGVIDVESEGVSFVGDDEEEEVSDNDEHS